MRWPVTAIAPLAGRPARIALILVLLACCGIRMGTASDEALSDPLALGAWLFVNHCERCHGPYENERIASAYDDGRQLKRAVEKDRCRVSWAARFGGPLNNRKIDAVVRYMQTWEELDAPPDLPDLPPPEVIEAPKTAPRDEKPAVTVAADTAEPLDRAYTVLMDSNPVAHGAYIYTLNCYRCHLSYEKARMGKGTSGETVKRTVANGKTSTQMKAFSRMKGGELKNSEIDAVVRYITAWERAGQPLAIAPRLLQAPDTDPAMLRPVGLPRFPTVKGDRPKGERIFAANCTRCHGTSGQGYIGRRLAKRWGVVRPDLRIKSIVKQGVPGSPMPAWSQNAGGPLGAMDVDDLVIFVAGLQPMP